MCCRRHGRRGRFGSPYRGPAVYVLGRMAYDKVQEHRANKRAVTAAMEALEAGPSTAARPETRQITAAEKPESLDPPRYHDVVSGGHPTIMDEKAGWVDERKWEEYDEEECDEECEVVYGEARVVNVNVTNGYRPQTARQ